MSNDARLPFNKSNGPSCTGREIRTPINGFGDRYSAIELCPCIILGLTG